MKKRRIKVRQLWKIKPVSKIKISGKVYDRKALKRALLEGELS